MQQDFLTQQHFAFRISQSEIRVRPQSYHFFRVVYSIVFRQLNSRKRQLGTSKFELFDRNFRPHRDRQLWNVFGS